MVQSVANSTHRQGLLSSTFVVPRTRTKLWEPAFCVCGPVAWNALPATIRNTTDSKLFKRLLKSHFYNRSFGDDDDNNKNKSALSNLGIGPLRCESKSPSVTVGRPKFTLQSAPYRTPIAKPHYSPPPWIRPTYDAKQHPDPIRRFPQCTGQTDVPTDRSSTGKFDDYRPLRYESDAA